MVMSSQSVNLLTLLLDMLCSLSGLPVPLSMYFRSPSEINRMGIMTIERISCSIATKVMWLNRDLDRRCLDLLVTDCVRERGMKNAVKTSEMIKS